MLGELLGLEPGPVTAFLTLLIGGLTMFLVFSSTSYGFFFIWQRKRFNPHYTPEPGMVPMAVRWGFLNILGNAVLTAPLHVLIATGHSKVYWDVGDFGWGYLALSVLMMLGVTETLIYWTHRALHLTPLYGWFHEPHHRYQRPMSWVGLAFNPIDSFLQGLPHHLCVFLFPVNAYVYLASVTFVTIWAVAIHDRVSVVRFGLINYTAHHTIHHWEYDYNFGQFTTIWDRIGRTYRDPRTHLIPRQSDGVPVPAMVA